MKTSLFLLVLACASAQFISLPERLGKVQTADRPAEIDFHAVINSFLEGAEIADIVANSTDCVDNTATFLTEGTQSLIEFIRNPNINNFFGMAEDLELVTPCIKSCFESAFEANERFYDYLKKFKFNPETWWKSVYDNASTKWMTAGSFAVQVKTAVENKDWPMAAKASGQLIRFLLDVPVVKAVLAQEPLVAPENMATDLHDFFEHFFQGTMHLNTTNVQICTNTARWWIDSWEEAFEAFRKGDTKTAWHFIAESFSKVYPMTYNCFHGVEDITIELAKHFDLTKPWIIIYHIGEGIRELHTATLEAYQLLQKGKFAEAGDVLGKMFYNVFFDPSE